MSETILRQTATGMGFNGCDQLSSDHCSCATWTPVVCPICDEEVIDGQEVIIVIREAFPYLAEDDRDQDWEYYAWHAGCDKGSLAAAKNAS